MTASWIRTGSPSARWNVLELEVVVVHPNVVDVRSCELHLRTKAC